MDRRNFFKSFLAAPLLTPFLLSSPRSSKETQLYLISDEPHKFSSLLLKELQKRKLFMDTRFRFLGFHPHKEQIRRELQRTGWIFNSHSSAAPVSISYTHLKQKVPPSFTFIKEGQVQDMRTQKLFSLWKEMSNQAPSSSLTVFTFKKRPLPVSSGKYVLVYKEGTAVDRFSLHQNVRKSYSARQGKLGIQIKNREVQVLEASCARKICLHSHPISLAGERIICAPNHFLLEIRGDRFVDTSIG